MPKYRNRTLEIRSFILRNVEDHPRGIAALTMEEFGISRTAVLKHLHSLIDDGRLAAEGKTKARRYEPIPISQHGVDLPVTPGLEESTVWRQEFRQHFEGVSRNVLDICHYGFTEMLNNVVDHSEATRVVVTLKRTESRIEIVVSDDGIGIFRKLQSELGLEDPRHVVLELSKGKLTTDPESHTGQGIFFTSRAFDSFTVCSDGLFFSRNNPGKGWLFESAQAKQKFMGTIVDLRVDPRSERLLTAVFDRYSAGADDYRFSRTIVPVYLARYGDENLVSRSQAKRLLARFDRFREVILDFAEIERIGQAFADEIFRVHARQHPGVQLVPLNMNDQVLKMVLRVVESPMEWLKNIEAYAREWQS